MSRTATGIVTFVLALGLLSGCSGGDSSASASHQASKSPSGAASAASPSAAAGAGTTYCKLLSTDFEQVFSSIHGPGDAKRAVALLQKVANSSPPAVRKDWTIIGGALGRLRVALTKAAALQQEQQAGKISKQQLQKETRKLLQQTQALQTPQTQAAGQAISQNAASYCGVKLGG
jgi:hypothetical protein